MVHVSELKIRGGIEDKSKIIFFSYLIIFISEINMFKPQKKKIGEEPNKQYCFVLILLCLP